MDRIKEIRTAERGSHIKAYTDHKLYSPGSWLAKPVKTVLDLLPLFESCREFRALDLGCGVGRNSISVAQALSDIPCRVDCVDILEMAIHKLKENAREYSVEDRIHGIVSSIEHYQIKANYYDLILAISALEHVDSAETFDCKLREIRNGIREHGVVCLILNTSVEESNKVTGEKMNPRFEVNLSTEEMQNHLKKTFSGWKILKETIVHQHYDIPRGNNIAEIETDVVTFVAKKEASNP